MADFFADSGPDIFSHPLPPRPDPRPPQEKPEKSAVRLRFAVRKPTMINVDRDLTFYRCLEVIGARFPGMTLGDSMYVRGRGEPKLKEEIEGWSNDDDVLDLHVRAPEYSRRIDGKVVHIGVRQGLIR
jgi:hypothetical protein